MVDVYHELYNVEEIATVDLRIPRSKAISTALSRHRDYELVQSLRSTNAELGGIEILVVDVECHGVPPQNEVGIKFRERLALVVREDPKALVEVLAIRRDFPLLIHQNQGAMGRIASLCLYFESPISVLRLWTPENFLRRIQWWLELSAKGELHPADQPVEHMFFSSKYELVLPWDLQVLRDGTERFVLDQSENRPDGGFTCSLVNSPGEKAKLTLIEIFLPAVVHGLVEHDPKTLGQLVDIFERREAGFYNLLIEKLRSLVPEGGCPEGADHAGTVVLLYIPLVRALGEVPSRVGNRAFLIPKGGLALGKDMGVLIHHDHRYYDGIGTQIGSAMHTNEEWKNQTIYTLEVLKRNSKEAARNQSGFQDEGPSAVLVGVGSLGSALMEIWGRGGWGEWTVIDKDHVKPHNLSRHTALDFQIGMPKAKAVEQLHTLAVGSASKITALCENATEFSIQVVRDALIDAALVVDVSTTLEYPRSASSVDEFARHFSAFISPSGNAAVLLAEDGQRHIRLRSLEAQYYRAIFQQEWGEGHLDKAAGTFWSGASCRDISMVMPYSKILGMASTLAEQIPVAYASPESLIRVWQRDASSGSVSVYDTLVKSERMIEFGAMKLFIDQGAEDDLRALRVGAFPNETGGILLGYYDFNMNTVVVVAGLPAPVDSKATPHSFERGVEGQLEEVQRISILTAGMVGYIGEWHSHPPGHSASPSTDDIKQLVYLTLGMAQDGLPALQLIVGEHEVAVIQGAAM